MQRANEYYEQALAITRVIGDRHNEGAYYLGGLYQAQENVSLARQCREQSLSIYEAIRKVRAATARGGNFTFATPPANATA